jgi:tetratricopeptide (TPR) repeat protein
MALSDSAKFTANANALASMYDNVQTQRTQLAQYAIQKAAAYMQENKNDEAVKEFKKALAFDPQNETAHTYIGKIYLSQGKTQEAIKEFKSVVQNDMTSVTARNNLGNAYLQAKRNSDAEKEFKTAARMDPLNPLADYTLGILYTQTERYSEAESQFNKVAKVSPRDGNVFYALGALYNKMGRNEDAVKQLEKALTLKKDFPNANFELGSAYAKIGNKDGGLYTAFEHSLFVLASVISTPTADRAIVDAGLKSYSGEKGSPWVHGREDVELTNISDEHGKLVLGPKAKPLKLGEKIWLIPGHCDPTVNLHDWYVGVRGLNSGEARVESLWPVAARGAVF